MADLWRIAAVGPSGGTFSDVAVQEYGLTVEDGTGLANADSYASLATATDYLSRHRNPAAWSTATDAAREQAARVGSQALDLMFGTRWVGDPATATQALHWPRVNAYDVSGRSISAAPLPLPLVHAAIELAVRYLEDPTSIMPDRAAGTGAAVSSSLSIGPISESVSFQGAAEVDAIFVVVERLLRTAGLIVSGNWMVR